jgi:hypothetical protein
VLRIISYKQFTVNHLVDYRLGNNIRDTQSRSLP